MLLKTLTKYWKFWIAHFTILSFTKIIKGGLIFVALAFITSYMLQLSIFSRFTRNTSIFNLGRNAPFSSSILSHFERNYDKTIPEYGIRGSYFTHKESAASILSVSSSSERAAKNKVRFLFFFFFRFYFRFLEFVLKRLHQTIRGFHIF